MNKSKPPRKTGSIKYPLEGVNPALHIFGNDVWKRLVVQQNRLNGKSHEKLVTWVLRSTLTETFSGKVFTVLLDEKVFECFEQDVRKRRYDIYVEEERTGYEIKSYKVCLNNFIRTQIQKDRWLLKNAKLDQVWWILSEGATGNVLHELTKSGIIYLNMPDKTAAFTNIMELYQ